MATGSSHSGSGIRIHENPKWDMSFSISRTGSNNVSVNCTKANTSGGYFGYTITIQVAKQDFSGNVNRETIVSHSGYDNFSGAQSINFSGIKKCWLVMKCNASTCDISSDAKTDAGYHIPGTDLTFGEAPTMNSLVNSNKYNNLDGVSASETSISLTWSGSWGDPKGTTYYSLDGAGYTSASSNVFTISGLKPGTTHTISVKVQNEMGTAGPKTITVRTLYDTPTANYNITPDLEEFLVNWDCNRPLASLTCIVNEVTDQSTNPVTTQNILSHNVSITSGDKTGNFKTCDLPPYPDDTGTCILKPKTLYEIIVKGAATSEYDDRPFTLTNPYVYTLDRSHITAISACTFGLPIDITIEGESEKHHKLKIWTEGNNLLPTFVFDDLEKGVYTFNPTQEQLDKMYRSIPNTGNTVSIHFLVTTHGDHLDYDDKQVDKTMTLTGIAKTAHVGDASNRPRRCQVWIGDAENKPRRVVMWVGDAEKKPRRTI